MRGSNWVAASLVACLLTGAPTADANEHQRGGFFIGFGLGAGGSQEEYVGFSDDGGGGAGSFRIGGAVSPNWALGLESTGFVRSTEVQGFNEDLVRRLNVMTFAATWFPEADGLYVRAGLGFAVARAEFGNLVGEEGGLGLLGGVGYEWRLSKKFALGPQFQYAYGSFDSDVIESVAFWSGTLQFNWWWP